MMSAFLKNVSRCAQTPSSVLKNPSRLAGLRQRRPFSSDSDDYASVQSPPQTSSAPSPKETASADVEDVSNEELKQRIEKFMKGDPEAIPSIFEAILQRKLSGKHKDGEDEELLKEMNLPEVNEDEEDIKGDDVHLYRNVKEDLESDISDNDK